MAYRLGSRRSNGAKQGRIQELGPAVITTSCRRDGGKSAIYGRKEVRKSRSARRRPARSISEARNAQYFIYCNLSEIRTRPWLWPVVLLADYSLPQERTAAAELPQ